METITTFGSSQIRPENPLYDTAVDIGAGFAQLDYKVMTGGYKDGVFFLCGKFIPGRCLLGRGARVDDWDYLANSCTLRGTVGSNPTLSDNAKRAT